MMIKQNLIIFSLLVIASCSENSNPDKLNSGVNTNPTSNFNGKVGFNKQQIKASVGETHTLDIVIQEFPTSEGGGLNLTFNPSVIKINNVVINDSTWDFVNKVDSIDNAKGKVSGILFSSYKGVTGDAVTASIEFNAIGVGESILMLSESSLNPFSSAGNNIQTTFSSANIKVLAQ